MPHTNREVVAHTFHPIGARKTKIFHRMLQFLLSFYVCKLTRVVHGIDVININTIEPRKTFDLCDRKNVNSSITDDMTASNCTN